MIGAVHILELHLFGQLLGELSGAVIEPVHILAEAIVIDAHIAVHRAAGVAAGFCPVEAGIIGIFAGGSVHHSAGSLTV